MASMNKNAGIYRWIVHREGSPDRIYIGQSVKLTLRRHEHLHALRHGIHKNPALQRAFREYGERAFRFEILENCAPEQLTEREQFFVDQQIRIAGRRSLYNALTLSVRSRLGLKNTAEQNAKIAAKQRGRARTPAELAGIRRMAEALKGRRLSPETIAKRTAKQKGRKQSAEERAMRSAILKARAYSHSAQSRARIAATKKARGQQPTPEAIAKAAVFNRGKSRPEKTRAAIILALRNRIRRPETYVKMWQTRRANLVARELAWPQ
jgi:group I intron endonuclease